MNATEPAQGGGRATAAQPEWLSLTELGRLYGISAVLCGRQLTQAGVRQAHGAPTRESLHRGLALLPHPQAHHRSALWQRQGCGAILEAQGLKPLASNRLVQLWADLLEALLQDSGSISTSAEEMADDMPGELVSSVNRELQQRGHGFRVTAGARAQPSRRASACLLARSSISRS